MKKMIAFTVSLTVLAVVASCQRSTVSGIYAGVKLSIGLWGSMDRTDVVLYLRTDGTFTDALESADWQTDVKGNYTVEGKTVTLTYADGDTDSYTLTDKGVLDGGNYVLFKLSIPTELPQAGFKYTGGSGGGGGLSGVPYVGTFNTQYIFFDGAGHFSHSAHNTVLIAGDNIGGGTSKDREDGGTYTYRDGVLKLTYGPDKESTHSLFLSTDGDGKAMIVLDGSLYFEEEANAEAGKGSPSKAGESAPLPTAPDLLRKVREAQGGDAIDQVRNIYLTAAIEGGGQLSMKTDYENGQSISEIRVDGKLVYAELYTATEKWQLANGKRADISANRIKEIANHAYLGANGLHKDRIAILEKGTVQEGKDGGFILAYEVGGQHFELEIDRDYRIEGETKTDLEGRKTVVSLGDYREVSGLIRPFYEKHVSGGNELTFRIAAYEVNQLTENDWNPPQ